MTLKMLTATQEETNPSTKRLNVDLPEPVHRKLKVHCAMTGQDMSAVVRKLISDYLNGDRAR